MISSKMEKAINDQIDREMYSAYLYMSMSAGASREGLKGIAIWFMVQFHEEMVHAMKMYEYILRQGRKCQTASYCTAPTDWKKPLTMYEKALEHEKTVTKNINDLLDLLFLRKTMPPRHSCSGMSLSRLKKKKMIPISFKSSR